MTKSTESKKKSDGSHWPWVIVALLVGNAAASGVLITIANASGSHAVEPDYYAKAVAWDQVMAQQRENKRLGWKLEEELTPKGDDGVSLQVTLTDAQGTAVSGAVLELETFHLARASDRLELVLRETGPGVYSTAWTSRRRGAWELRLRAQRDGLVFTRRVVAMTAGSEPVE